MANTFVTGNYYKNERREIVILVTSRTKCFITYKAFWISDLNNCYQEGKIKVRVNENNDEFVLIDGFSKYSSVDEYVKYVKEEVNVKEEEVKETVEDSDLPLTNAIALVGKVTEVKEEVEFTLTDDNKAAIQAIVKLDPVRCNWSNLERIAYSKLTAWVSYPHDSRDIRGVYEGALLVLNTISKEDKARVKELVVEGKKKITLEDSDLPTNAIANNAKDLVLPLTKSLTFKEVREYAENAGYEIEPLGGMFRLIKNNVIKTFPSLKTLQLFITEELVEKKEITLEDSDLPSPDNNAIATVNNLEEEVKENMLTKESYAAIKLLVKMDFTTRGLTQFEVMALTSLKKYVENGIEPKLIKTFAEVLIKKLTPEERLILRDKSLEKVFKGRRRE
jgi:hypothetical protein